MRRHWFTPLRGLVEDQRMERTMSLLGLVVSVGMYVIMQSPACSQAFPIKVIRIVTAEPGGINDFSSRVIAQALAPNGQHLLSSRLIALD